MNSRAATLARLPLLLIEDERSVMDFIRTALERNGYACSTANSAAEGIRTLETGRFGGIISDMRTPGRGQRRRRAFLDRAASAGIEGPHALYYRRYRE